jgi:hypothetical protein
MLAVTPALSAGFERVIVPDSDGQSLEAGIWYPSAAPRPLSRSGFTGRSSRPTGTSPGVACRSSSCRTAAAARSKAITTPR